jgi:hypothetical protein
MIRSRLMEGESAQRNPNMQLKAAEESKLSPANTIEKQERSTEETAEVTGLSEAETRTEKDIAVDIIHLFGKSGQLESARRIQKVRMSELIEEIYLAFRRRTIDGLPLPHSAAFRDLSPDVEDLLKTLALAGSSDPETFYELETKIEDYGLKTGCESVEQVFAIWLSGN